MSETLGTISKMENRPFDYPPSISLDPFTKSINLDAGELRGSFFNGSCEWWPQDWKRRK